MFRPKSVISSNGDTNLVLVKVGELEGLSDNTLKVVELVGSRLVVGLVVFTIPKDGRLDRLKRSVSVGEAVRLKDVIETFNH